MMATEAWGYDREGGKEDLSRTSPNLCIIHEETNEHFIGHWANGGPSTSKVYFSRITTRYPTPHEVSEFDGRTIILGNNPHFQLRIKEMEKEYRRQERGKNISAFLSKIKEGSIEQRTFSILPYPFIIKGKKDKRFSIFSLGWERSETDPDTVIYALGIARRGVKYSPVILIHLGRPIKNSPWEECSDFVNYGWIKEWITENISEYTHLSIISSHQLE
jgi:hypothetical protein